MQVTDKVFLVTGGGSGIGQQVVLGLLRRGARVAAVDMRPESLEATALLAGAGERLTTHVVDVTDRTGVDAAIDDVRASHGSLDGLVNVAGIIQKFVRFSELQDADIDKVMAVNFWGVVHTTRAALPHLLKRPEACIVNVSSMGGFTPVPGQSVYGASKAAVKLLTEALYAELLDTEVAVTVVFPGAVATEITTNSGVTIDSPAGAEPSRAMQPTSASAAAEAIVVAIEKGSYRVLIGKDARMLDRLARLAPRRATELVARKMASLLG